MKDYLKLYAFGRIITLCCASFSTQFTCAQGKNSLVEEIVVTGSYLKKKSYNEVGSPIDIIGRSDLDADAPNGRLIDTLRFLPFNSGNFSGLTPGGDGGPQEGRLGGGTVDVRGLGGAATLVLLNGQRHTGFPLSQDGRVDINSLLPGIMLERVEILKDGASAVYGSDAVAGVMNFITRDDFEGVEFRADARGTYGATQDAFDHNNKTFGFLFGSPAESDVRIVAGIEYFNQDNLVFGEVKQVPVFTARGASSFGNPGSFVVPVRDQVGSITGMQTLPDPDCQAVIDANINRDPAFSQTSSSLDSAANLCRITFPNQPFLLDEERISARVETQWNLQNDIQFKQAFSFARSETLDVFNATTPVLNFPTVPGTHPANPFIARDANGNQLFALDANNDGIPDRDSNNQVILDPAGIAFNEDVLFRGRPYSATNFGVVSPAQELETMRIEFGLGNDSSEWTWDLSWSYSRQELIRRGPDSVFSKLQEALQGTGGPGGDLYFNPFGSSLLGDTFVNDPSLEESIRVVLIDQHFTTTTTFDGVIAGDLFELPAGPLATAFGFQVRDERLSQDFDHLKTIGEVSFFGNGDIDFTASDNVLAVFFEAAAPILDSQAVDIDFSVAGRYEEKDSTGDGSFNPKYSLRFHNNIFSVGASYATSFLAPSLFQSGGLIAQFANVFDPQSNTLEQVSTRIIGDPNLEDQESTSNSLSFKLTPTENFSLDLTYWRFDFENLIAASLTQAIVDADPNGPLVQRNSSGIISLVNRPFFNAGSIETDGVDFSILYRFLKNFTLSSKGTFVNSYDVQESVGGAVIDGVGSDNNGNIGSAIAEWRNNTRIAWNSGDHEISFIGRYYSDVTRSRGGDEGVAKARWVFDGQYSYGFDNILGSETDVLLTLGARNIFNNEPNIVLTTDNQFFVGTFQESV